MYQKKHYECSSSNLLPSNINKQNYMARPAKNVADSAFEIKDNIHNLAIQNIRLNTKILQ